MRNILYLILSLVLTVSTAQAQFPSRVDFKESGRILRNINYEALYKSKNEMDVYISSRPRLNNPTVFLIHGGAYTKGSKGDLRHLALDLMEDGFHVVAIDYSKLSKRSSGSTKEVTIEEMLLNIWHAIQFVQLKSSEWNIAPNGYHFFGEECGGHLALLAAYRFKDNVQSVTAVGAITDLRDIKSFRRLTGSPYRTHTLFEKLVGNVPNRSRVDLPKEYINASPVYQVKKVPTLLIHGDEDPVVPVEQGIKMERALLEHKVHNSRLMVLTGGGSNLVFDEEWYPSVYNSFVSFITQ